MAFKYINPGYAALFNNPNGMVQVTDATKGKNGVAVHTNLNGSSYTCYPSVLPYKSADVWLRFDAWLHTVSGVYSTVRFGVRGNTGSEYYSNSLHMDVQSGSLSLISYNYTGSNYSTYKFVSSVYYTNLQENYGIKPNALNKWWMHIHYGVAGEGFIQFYVNGKQLYTTNKSTAVSTANDSCAKQLVIYASANSPLSEMIVSDEELHPLEEIVELPFGTVEGNMTRRESGIYVANSAGQSLAATPDVVSLAENYGENSTVTGALVMGNPAYRTGAAISQLTAFQKDNGAATNYDSVTLTEDTDGIIYSSRPLSGKTIADLGNMQFGWRS